MAKDEVQRDARKIFEQTVAKELDKGATDNQAYDRAQKAADDYADSQYRKSR